MKKILLTLLFPFFCFAKDSASFQLEVGGRWDRVRTTGSANDVVASQNGAFLLGPLQLVGLNRKMEDMNLFHVGGKIALQPYHVFFLRASVDYGIFFTDSEEVFQAALINPPIVNLLFLTNKNTIEHKQFSLDLVGEGGFLTYVRPNFQMGFTVGYGYYLLRMSEENRVETNCMLARALFYYRIGKSWRVDLELEALFLGQYDQIITFNPQAPSDNSGTVTFESGRVKTNHVWGYGGLLGLSWLFGPRWALTLAYQLRNIDTPTVHTKSFGGKADLASFWSAQKGSLILSYSY